MHPPHGEPWIFHFWRVIARGLAFAFVGPAIGALFSPGIFLLPLSVVLAYVTSTIPAFATGCCMAIASLFITRRATLYKIAALTGTVLSAPVGLLLGATPAAIGLIAIHAISGAIAATICTWMTVSTRQPGDAWAN